MRWGGICGGLGDFVSEPLPTIRTARGEGKREAMTAFVVCGHSPGSIDAPATGRYVPAAVVKLYQLSDLCSGWATTAFHNTGHGSILVEGLIIEG